MVGMHDLIVSPSSSSTRRSTPWVLGCCGPMLTVIVSVRSSAIVYQSPITKRSLTHSVPPTQPIALDVRLELVFAHLEWLVGLRGLANLHGIVLPRRMAVPVLRHQQPAKIRMAGEDDAEHVPHFALGPARGGPDALHRRDDSINLVRRRSHFQAKAVATWDGQQVIHDLEPRLAREVVGR